MTVPSAIGFPKPFFGDEPLRVPVLASAPGVVALLKPAGVAWDDHPWNPAGAPHVVGAIREQLAGGKPEMIALGLAKPASVHYLEPEVGGVALLADRESGSLDAWRNAFGSALLKFTYNFLALTADAPEEGGDCPLPVAAHRTEARALVSHASGKKSLTTFRVLERLGKWTLWEATTSLPRPHQVRLHAAEAGLRIIGETLYSNGGDILLSETRKKGRLNKGTDKPIAPGLALRLVSVDGSAVEPSLGVITGVDDAWSGLLVRLRKVG